jgi:hypothetical protein
VKHFEDFNEDQFDFHSYCLRKVTLRAYVSVLRFEDDVYGQDYYCQAAAGIIDIYLHLADNPMNNDTAEPDYSTMTAAERKKAKAVARKKKKVQEKKETEIREKEAENGNNKNQKGGKASATEEDPFGKEMLNKDALDEAKKYSSMLTQYAPTSLKTWVLQYDVAVRRKKTLMALQALFKARAIDPNSSELFTRVIDFSGRLDDIGHLPETVRRVIDEDAPKLLESKSVSDYAKKAAERIRSDVQVDLPFRSAVARALVETKVGSVSEAASLITEGGINARRVTAETCSDALQVLKSFGNDGTKAVEEWSAAVRSRFLEASIA